MYDMSHLKKLSALGRHTPDALKAFETMNAAVFADGSLTTKTKELMAVAVAIAVQCPYCIEIHKASAGRAIDSTSQRTVHQQRSDMLHLEPVMRHGAPLATVGDARVVGVRARFRY